MTQKEIDKMGGDPISEEGKIFLSEIPVVSGLTTGEYNDLAHDFLVTTKHNQFTSGDDEGYERFDTEYINLTYEPVIELVNYSKRMILKSIFVLEVAFILFVPFLTKLMVFPLKK